MAISRDTSTVNFQNRGTSWTFSYTLTGSNNFLVVGYRIDSSVTISNVAWNTSETMTLVGSASPLAGTTLYLYHLPNATAGTFNVTTTQSGTANVAIFVASYNSTKTTGQPDTTANDSQTTNPTTVSYTTTADQCWMTGLCADANDDTATITSGGTVLQSNGTHTRFFDTNGAVSAGSNSVVINHTLSGQALKTLLVAFSPAATGDTLWAQTCL